MSKLARGVSYVAVFATGSLVAGLALGFSQNFGQARTPQSSEETAITDSTDLAASETITEDSGVTKQNSEPGEKTATTANSAPAEGITLIGDIRRGTLVVVQGVVERVSDEDEFVLADGSGRIPVWTGVTFFPVEEGERVTVRGFVDDDLILEIYAQEIAKQDGSKVTISGSTW